MSSNKSQDKQTPELTAQGVSSELSASAVTIKECVEDLQAFVNERKSFRGQSQPAAVEAKFELAVNALGKVAVELDKLNERVASLEAENAALKQELAAVKQ